MKIIERSRGFGAGMSYSSSLGIDSFRIFLNKFYANKFFNQCNQTQFINYLNFNSNKLYFYPSVKSQILFSFDSENQTYLLNILKIVYVKRLSGKCRFLKVQKIKNCNNFIMWISFSILILKQK